MTGSASYAEATEIAGGLELNAGVHPIFEGEYVAFYRALEAALQSAGVTLRKKTRDMEDYLEAWRTGEMDVMIGRWVGDHADTDTFAHFLHSQGETAGEYTGSAEMDTLIMNGQTEMDPGTRHSIYREIDAIIHKEAFLIPLFHEKTYRFARPEIEGLTVSYTMPVVAYEDLRFRT